MEAAEEEGADAEEAERGAGFDPAGALSWCCEAEADVDSVSWEWVLMVMSSCRWSWHGVFGVLFGVGDLPVCMETKDPQSEMAELSRRPVMM